MFGRAAIRLGIGPHSSIFSFFISLFCLVPCDRLSWLFASFWAHVNLLHRIVSCRIAGDRLTNSATALSCLIINKPSGVVSRRYDRFCSCLVLVVFMVL